jgi:hypothetical protein
MKLLIAIIAIFSLSGCVTRNYAQLKYREGKMDAYREINEIHARHADKKDPGLHHPIGRIKDSPAPIGYVCSYCNRIFRIRRVGTTCAVYHENGCCHYGEEEIKQ